MTEDARESGGDRGRRGRRQHGAGAAEATPGVPRRRDRGQVQRRNAERRRRRSFPAGHVRLRSQPASVAVSSAAASVLKIIFKFFISIEVKTLAEGACGLLK